MVKVVGFEENVNFLSRHLIQVRSSQGLEAEEAYSSDTKGQAISTGKRDSERLGGSRECFIWIQPIPRFEILLFNSPHPNFHMRNLAQL